MKRLICTLILLPLPALAGNSRGDALLHLGIGALLSGTTYYVACSQGAGHTVGTIGGFTLSIGAAVAKESIDEKFDFEDVMLTAGGGLIGLVGASALGACEDEIKAIPPEKLDRFHEWKQEQKRKEQEEKQ